VKENSFATIIENSLTLCDAEQVTKLLKMFDAVKSLALSFSSNRQWIWPQGHRDRWTNRGPLNGQFLSDDADGSLVF
jgi:hypothetical protein